MSWVRTSSVPARALLARLPTTSPASSTSGVYDFWNIYSWAERGGINACKDPLGSQYQAPTGNSHVSVYTDEHGEAYVVFYPYTGLNLTPDSNNRCDLSPGVYGTAKITATGMYPDQPITYEPNQGEKVSNELTKTANHLASKVLKCVPKTVATATTPGEALCVETILDFNGDPIVGALVKFAKDPTGGKFDADSVKGTFGGLAVDTRDQGVCRRRQLRPVRHPQDRQVRSGQRARDVHGWLRQRDHGEPRHQVRATASRV